MRRTDLEAALGADHTWAKRLIEQGDPYRLTDSVFTLVAALVHAAGGRIVVSPQKWVVADSDRLERTEGLDGTVTLTYRVTVRAAPTEGDTP